MESVFTKSFTGVSPTRVDVFFKEETLHKIIAQRDRNMLTLRYRDDELVEMQWNRDQPIAVTGRLHGKVLGAEYNNGKLVVSAEGTKYYDDVQVKDIGSDGEEVYYKGIYISNLNKYVTSTEGLIGSIYRDYVIVERNRNGYRSRLTHRYSDHIIMLLSMAKNRSLPFERIDNLSPWCLEEIVNTLSVMFKERIYLSYMDLLFGKKLELITFETYEDVDSCNRVEMTDVQLDDCYARILSDDLNVDALILDGDGNFHRFGNVDETWEQKVLDLKDDI